MIPISTTIMAYLPVPWLGSRCRWRFQYHCTTFCRNRKMSSSKCVPPLKKRNMNPSWQSPWPSEDVGSCCRSCWMEKPLGWGYLDLPHHPHLRVGHTLWSTRVMGCPRVQVRVGRNKFRRELRNARLVGQADTCSQVLRSCNTRVSITPDSDSSPYSVIITVHLISKLQVLLYPRKYTLPLMLLCI